MGFTNKIRY